MGKSDARANFVLLRNDERRLYRRKNRELRMLPMRMRHAPELKRWHSIRVEIIPSRILVVSRLHFFPRRGKKLINFLFAEDVKNINKSVFVRVVGFFLMFRSH